ncbi:hypothetical protein QTP88_015138 [Uroleucon formosanum]
MSPVQTTAQVQMTPRPMYMKAPLTTVDGRFYLGPAMYCTQPPRLPCCVIADNLQHPPPPFPEYYVGPAWFDVFGPPPMSCCVAASWFRYPPPPTFTAPTWFFQAVYMKTHIRRVVLKRDYFLFKYGNFSFFFIIIVNTNTLWQNRSILSWQALYLISNIVINHDEKKAKQCLCVLFTCSLLALFPTTYHH